MMVGVLAVQGSFEEHLQALKRLESEVRLVKTSNDLRDIDALVIPGGESTTIGGFLKKHGLASAIGKDLPIFGTCAGLIVLAEDIAGKHQKGQGLLKRMDIEVERNAYGRQRESFEADVDLVWDEKPFKGVFIRAPKIIRYGPDVKVMAWHNETPVLVRQGNLLACAFHPELTEDMRIHQYFVEEVVKNDKK